MIREVFFDIKYHGRSPSANVIGLRNEGREHSQPGVQGIIPWPPEA